MGIEDALAGIDAALRLYPGGEVVVRYEPRRDTFWVQAQICGDPAWPAKVTAIRDGYGRTLDAALRALWAGDTGLWRYMDEEAWREAAYPANRPAASNPGPLTGQHLGRGDG